MSEDTKIETAATVAPAADVATATPPPAEAPVTPAPAEATAAAPAGDAAAPAEGEKKGPKKEKIPKAEKEAKKAAAEAERKAAAEAKAAEKAAAAAAKKAIADKAAEEAAAKEKATPFEHVLDKSFLEAPMTAALVPFQDMPKPQRVEAVRKGIVACAEAGGKLEIVAAELLYEVRRGEYWKEFKHKKADGTEAAYGSFEEYIENEVPFRRRKAFYLMSIYEKFVVELKVPVDILREVEWSKAKEILPVVNEKNWKDLLEVLPNMSVKEVIDMVAGVKGSSTKTTTKTGGPKAAPVVGATPETGDDAEMFKVTFILFESQKNNIEAALKVAKFETSSDKPGHLLDVIATDYLAGRATTEGTEALDALCGRLDTHLQRLERTFGVKLEVVGVTTMARPDAPPAAAPAAAPAA